MSFLAGRLAAGREGAYFLQESKQAVTRIAQKVNPTTKNNNSSSPEHEFNNDVLPEVLRHSLPSKIFYEPTDASSLSTASKWGLPKDPNASSVHPDALNPLKAYLSLPQVTFGPRRWQLPEMENGVTASTANDLRLDRTPHINPEKMKAAAEGLTHVGKAFAIATGIVFGGTALTCTTVASKLGLHNSEDIRTKGRDLVQPKFEVVRKQLLPIKVWAEKVAEKLQLDREEIIKEKAIVKELSRILGAKRSS